MSSELYIRKKMHICKSLDLGSVFVPCRTDNISFGKMIIFNICSEIIFDDTIIFCRFLSNHLKGRRGRWEVNVQWFLATPGGNQVDGLPPVSNTTVVDISETIGHITVQAFFERA
jgi:hypothetical protein